MSTIQQLQKEIYQDKINKGFDAKDLKLEILLMLEKFAKLAEAAHKDSKWEAKKELAGMIICCLSLAEMLEVDLEEIIRKKMVANEAKEHAHGRGGWTQLDRF